MSIAYTDTGDQRRKYDTQLKTNWSNLFYYIYYIQVTSENINHTLRNKIHDVLYF